MLKSGGIRVMREVRALKAFRAGKGAQLILQGQTVNVDDQFADMLISRGIATAVDADIGALGSDDEDDEQSTDGDESDVDQKSDFAKLPAKSAPLGEWEEYARQNDISLTGLRNRNEKVAFIRKTVAGE